MLKMNSSIADCKLLFVTANQNKLKPNKNKLKPLFKTLFKTSLKTSWLNEKRSAIGYLYPLKISAKNPKSKDQKTIFNGSKKSRWDSSGRPMKIAVDRKQGQSRRRRPESLRSTGWKFRSTDGKFRSTGGNFGRPTVLKQVYPIL